MSSNNNDDNNSNDDDDDDGESLERARADLEMLLAAYPDEVVQQQQSSSDDHHDFEEEEEDNLHTLCFPLQYLLRLSSTAHIHLQTTHGYPIQSNVQIHGYRCSPEEKSRMEATVSAIRQMSKVCLEEGVEGGFRCVSIALETWKEEDAACPSEVKNDTFDRTLATTPQPTQDGYNSNTTTASSSFHWISGTSLVDRKSVFVAHVCRIHREVDVQPALQSLLESNPKLQKATHNMWAYRILEAVDNNNNNNNKHATTTTTTTTTTNNINNNTHTVSFLLKHDHCDDGEDAAGSRLSHLLELRRETNVFVVVSRWFGGTHLGPKRFAHINNVARELLVQLENMK